MYDDDDEHLDDPIARALLSDSAYARQKVHRASLFSLSPTRTLRWQGCLLFGLALVVPAAMSLPPAVRETVLAGDPLGASPTALLLGMAALAVHVGTGTLLAATATVADRYGDVLEDGAAEIVVAVEEFATILGLGLGGIFVLATNAYVLVGHAGIDALDAYARFGGASPLTPSGTAVSVVELAAVAVVLGSLTVALSWVLERDGSVAVTGPSIDRDE